MIAATNGNFISIFEFSTGEKVADLRGHNGKVRSLHWLESGHQLMSCGQDGAVYLWDIDGKRAGEFVNKGVLYTAAVCTPTTAFAVGSDRKLTELDMPELSLSQDRNADALLSHLAVSMTKNCLFSAAGDPGKYLFMHMLPANH
jgi:WD40 repeat protein